MGRIVFGIVRQAGVLADISYQWQQISGAPAVFANEAARDVIYAASPALLAELDADPTMAVAIGSGPGSIGLQRAYTRRDGEWVEIPITLPYPQTEEMQDLVGAMFNIGQHTGITVNYDDAGNRINLSVP